MGADVGGWLGAVLGVAVGSLGGDDGIGGGVPVAPGRALGVGGGAATALGTGVGAEVGATALGTGVGPLGPLTLAVGAGVEAGGGRTATAVGVALGRTPVGSGEDPARRRGVARSGRRRRGGDVTAAGRRPRGCGGTRCGEILLWGEHRPDGEGEDHEAEIDATQGDDEPMALRRRQLAPPVTAHPWTPS